MAQKVRTSELFTAQKPNVKKTHAWTAHQNIYGLKAYNAYIKEK